MKTVTVFLLLLAANGCAPSPRPAVKPVQTENDATAVKPGQTENDARELRARNLKEMLMAFDALADRAHLCLEASDKRDLDRWKRELDECKADQAHGIAQFRGAHPDVAFITDYPDCLSTKVGDKSGLAKVEAETACKAAFDRAAKDYVDGTAR